MANKQEVDGYFFNKIQKKYVTQRKQYSFMSFYKKLVPFVEHLPDRKMLLRVMSIMHVEGKLSKKDGACVNRKIDILKGALLLNENKKGGCYGGD